MATMSTMIASNAVLGGLRSLHRASVKKMSLRGNTLSLGSAKATGARRNDRGLKIRSEGVRESVDEATKTVISREEILRNQAENESEKKSVLGTEPTSSGSFYPRPEVERRPETGNKELGSIFVFDGAVPEIVNGRLAMVGLVWALLAEKMSGLTVFEQLYTPAGGFGLVFYVAVVQIITFASVIPILNGSIKDVPKERFLKLFIEKGHFHNNVDEIRRAILPQIFTDAVGRQLNASEVDLMLRYFHFKPGNMTYEEFYQAIDDMKADRAVSPPPIITKVAKSLKGKGPPRQKTLNSEIEDMKHKHRRDPLGPTDVLTRPLTTNMEYGWETMLYPGDSSIPNSERKAYFAKGGTDVTQGEGLTLETYYGVENIRI